MKLVLLDIGALSQAKYLNIAMELPEGENSTFKGTCAAGFNTKISRF